MILAIFFVMKEADEFEKKPHFHHGQLYIDGALFKNS